jgi:hypothetical protein
MLEDLLLQTITKAMPSVRLTRSLFGKKEVFAMRFVRCKKVIRWAVTLENSSDFLFEIFSLYLLNLALKF